MDITLYFEEFIKKSKYRPYKKICRSLLLGGKDYSLNAQKDYENSESLPYNMRECVKSYTHDKDSAISMFRDFVEYIAGKGIDVKVDFPPIPVSNSFERLMFIAKYLQDSTHSITDLPDILWVSERTIEDDIRRLRGQIDPIRVCGKEFHIPDTTRQDGHIEFSSTAHPIFLAENLAQVLVLLKGLKEMSLNPLYKQYAKKTASDIWVQLSDYAKERIDYVFRELMPEDLAWYKSLEEKDDRRFLTEEMVSQVHNKGTNVILNCMKVVKPFCVEYTNGNETFFYKDCVYIERSYRTDPFRIDVECNAGRITLLLDHVIRSAYTAEELTAI